MGGLTRLILVSLLCGCTSVGYDFDGSFITENIEYLEGIEYISIFKSPAEAQSRKAAVKVTSVDVYGNKIGGSGAYITHKGNHYIVTAAHVVEDSSRVLIRGSGELIVASVAYVNSSSDLALLSIAGMFTRDPIPWRVSKQVNVGDKLVYSGFPNSMGLLTIKGEVAGFYEGAIVAHTYVWKGASGSLVLDEKGRIVGVVSAVDVGTDIGDYPTIIEDVGLIASTYSLDRYLNR